MDLDTLGNTNCFALAANFASRRVVYFSFCLFCWLLLRFLIDKSESKGTNSDGEGPKKRAAVSTDRERPANAARTGAPSDTCRMGDILIPRRQGIEDEEIKVRKLVKARDVKDGAVLSFVWEYLGVMAYVRQATKFLDA